MDRSSLTLVLVSIFDLKESLFSIQSKIQNSEKLSKEEKESLLERVHNLVDTVTQLENQLYQSAKQEVDLWVIVDRALLSAHEIMILLQGEKDITPISELHDEILRIERDLYLKGVE